MWIEGIGVSIGKLIRFVQVDRQRNFIAHREGAVKIDLLELEGVRAGVEVFDGVRVVPGFVCSARARDKRAALGSYLCFLFAAFRVDSVVENLEAGVVEFGRCGPGKMRSIAISCSGESGEFYGDCCIGQVEVCEEVSTASIGV